MNKRPILKLKLKTTDIVIEGICWFVLGLLWILTIFSYNSLPDTIPIHFNMEGKVDRYGDKGEIISLPLVGTIIFIGISILNKFPHIFNYLAEITTENALTQYQSATRMLRILKLVVILIFITITLLTINVSINNGNEINLWLIFILIGVLFIITAFYTFKSLKSKQHSIKHEE